jgi:hypothetical protein
VKWDPARVAQDMEMLTLNGSYAFDQNECLSQGQIKSYFYCLALRQRSQQHISSQQQTQSTHSTPQIALSVPMRDNTQSSSTTRTNDTDTDEDEDDRDLNVYSWRQMVDQARSNLGTSSTSVTKSPTTSLGQRSTITSNRILRSKRKSIDDQF